MSMRRFTAADLDTGLVPVTLGLAPAPSLSEALLRECRDMGPTLESRVSGPLGRHGVLVWAGCGRILMLCYVMQEDNMRQTNKRGGRGGEEPEPRLLGDDMT